MSVTTLDGGRADSISGSNNTLQVQADGITPPSASNCLEAILPESDLSSQNTLRPEISPPTSASSAQCCTTSSGMASLISLSNSYIPDMDTLSKTSERFQGLLDRQSGGVTASGIGRRRGRIFGNAARERTRVKTLRSAFLDLQRTLPSVPPDTKLSKLDVLVLATTYIGHLMKTLEEGPGNVQPFQPSVAGIGQSLRQSWDQTNSVASVAAKDYLHPVKKWPMRTRLYAGIAASAHNGSASSSSSSPRDGHQESPGTSRFDMSHIQ